MPHPEASSLGNSYYYLSLSVGCSNSSLNFCNFSLILFLGLCRKYHLKRLFNLKPSWSLTLAANKSIFVILFIRKCCHCLAKGHNRSVLFYCSPITVSQKALMISWRGGSIDVLPDANEDEKYKLLYLGSIWGRDKILITTFLNISAFSGVWEALHSICVIPFSFLCQVTHCFVSQD